MAQKVLLLCIDLSSIEDDGLKIDFEVVGLKVALEAWLSIKLRMRWAET